MTTLTEPVAASWLRDLTRYLATGPIRIRRMKMAARGCGSSGNSVGSSGVLTLRVRKPEPLKPQRIEIGGGEASEEPKHVEGATA